MGTSHQVFLVLGCLLTGMYHHMHLGSPNSLFQGADVHALWASHLHLGPKGARQNQQELLVPFDKWHQFHFKTSAFCQGSEGRNNLDIDMLSELAHCLLSLSGMGLQQGRRSADAQIE